MSGRLKIYLKPNERIYLNGAVIRVDRKVAIEFLNDVVFLLEAHVLQQEDATTPLKQLYFFVQSILIEPKTEAVARQLFEHLYKDLLMTFKNQDILEALVAAKASVDSGRPFDALKKIRGLFELEKGVIGAVTVQGIGRAVA